MSARSKHLKGCARCQRLGGGSHARPRSNGASCREGPARDSILSLNHEGPEDEDDKDGQGDVQVGDGVESVVRRCPSLATQALGIAGQSKRLGLLALPAPAEVQRDRIHAHRIGAKTRQVARGGINAENVEVIAGAVQDEEVVP